MLLVLLVGALAVALALNDTLTTPAKRRVLAAVKASELDGATLRLFQNNMQISGDVKPEDFQECDFTGYASVLTPAWVGPSTQVDGEACLVSPMATFAATGPGTTNQAYGWFLLSKLANTPVFAAGNFENYATFADVGDSLSLVVQYFSDGRCEVVLVE